MKIVLITNNLLPAPMENGSSQYLWSLVTSLTNTDNDIHLISYNFHEERWLNLLKCHNKAGLEDKFSHFGISLHLIPVHNNSKDKINKFAMIKKVFFPNYSDFYDGFFYTTFVNQELGKLKPDMVISYTTDSIASVMGLGNKLSFKFVGIVVDMDHLVWFYRRRISNFNKPFFKKLNIGKWLAEYQLSRVSTELIMKCDKVICSANHHTNWLVKHRVKNVKYFPVTILDHKHVGWLDQRSRSFETSVPVISLIGKVNGIATLEGLYQLKNFLPELIQLHNETNLELHIIGGGDLPKSLMVDFSQYGWIRRVGYLEYLDQAFLDSNAILVPTSIPLGFRTRISEAFSFGCCVIAHKSNALGMPELIHNRNILLYENSLQFLKCLRLSIYDKDKNLFLGEQARITYENYYDGKKVSDKIIEYCLE